MLKRHTTYTLEIDGQDYPAPFGDESGTMSYTATAYTSADGLRAVVGCLCQDDSPADPFEEFDEGEFYQFDRSYKHYTQRPDIDEFKRIIRANPGRVFTHDGTGDHHGPGTTLCRVVAGPLTVKDTKGENCAAEKALDMSYGYYIAPADATDPAQYAKGALDQYSAWCNGDVYWVLIWQYTRATIEDKWQLDEDSRDECWGYYRYNHAREELTAALDAAKGEIG